MRKMVEPPKGDDVSVKTDFHEGWVEVEMPISGGWYAYGKYAMQAGELRLLETRVFPGTRRPLRVVSRDPKAGPFGPTLAEDGLPLPEFGQWDGGMATVDAATTAGAQINAGTMKRFPLREMREHAEWHANVRRLVYHMLPDDEGWAGFKSDMDKYVTERTKPSDLRLAQYAAQYVEFAEQESTRNRPRAELAKLLGHDPEIIRDLLASARRAGLLKSNGQGTRGGCLTPKGLDILERATASEGTKS
jgi:hypothetical protein